VLVSSIVTFNSRFSAMTVILEVSCVSLGKHRVVLVITGSFNFFTIMCNIAVLHRSVCNVYGRYLGKTMQVQAKCSHFVEVLTLSPLECENCAPCRERHFEFQLLVDHF